MKIVFLDFDGVLVNARSFNPAPGVTRSGPYAGADPPCVAALNRILLTTGARIVITSTWRYGRSLEDLQELLRSWGVSGQVVGLTPRGGNRGDQIATWLRGNRSAKDNDVQRYAILDDDESAGYALPGLILTEFNVGLTERDADRAIEILNGGRE
jgi:hypothetical protein